MESEDEPLPQPRSSIRPEKVHKSRADEIIDVYPQDTFMPNGHYDQEVSGKYRILSWNMIGIVAIRRELQFTSIDVDFANKTFHRNLVLADDFGVCMAAMNYSGLLVASKAAPSDDDYENEELFGEDDLAQRKKNSNIHFKPFNEYKDAKEWNYELKNGESVECLAVGSGWCTVLTSCNYLRVFSTDGI